MTAFADKSCTIQKIALTLQTQNPADTPRARIASAGNKASKGPSGGMVDALVSGASVERRAGSIPVLGTTKLCKRIEKSIVYRVFLFSTPKIWSHLVAFRIS